MNNNNKLMSNPVPMIIKAIPIIKGWKCILFPLNGISGLPIEYKKINIPNKRNEIPDANSLCVKLITALILVPQLFTN